jgi:hypothetical protein
VDKTRTFPFARGSLPKGFTLNEPGNSDPKLCTCNDIDFSLHCAPSSSSRSSWQDKETDVPVEATPRRIPVSKLLSRTLRLLSGGEKARTYKQARLRICTRKRIRISLSKPRPRLRDARLTPTASPSDRSQTARRCRPLYYAALRNPSPRRLASRASVPPEKSEDKVNIGR